MSVWMYVTNVTLHYYSETKTDRQLIFSVNRDEGARSLIYEEKSLYRRWYGGYKGSNTPRPQIRNLTITLRLINLQSHFLTRTLLYTIKLSLKISGFI